jgi:uncharacterized protein (DUF433 family)
VTSERSKRQYVSYQKRDRTVSLPNLVLEAAVMGQPVIHSNPQIQGGVPVFIGTRVPVKNLFDYLESGDSLDEFLEDFPSVSREQAIAVLEQAREALATDAHPA